jgi:hypothetical protein
LTVCTIHPSHSCATQGARFGRVKRPITGHHFRSVGDTGKERDEILQSVGMKVVSLFREG